MATNVYKLGTTYGGLTNVRSLATPIPYPYSDPAPFSRVEDAASGARYGFGSPIIKWSWKFLRRAQRDFLRSTYCASPAMSNTVYVAQLDTEGTERAYLGTMVWPVPEDVQAERVLDFVLIFRDLEIVTS